MEKLKKFCNWNTPLSRHEYFFWGVGLFTLKYPLDKWVATGIFNKPWSPTAYFSLLSNPLFNKESADFEFWLAMMVVALPFLLLGLILTGRRLKTLGLSLYLIILFMTPFLNIMFFSLLLLLKEREYDKNPGETEKPMFLERIASRFGRYQVLLAYAGGFLLLASYFGFTIIGGAKYGIGSFLAIPFVSGFFTVSVLSRRGALTKKQVLISANGPILVSLLALLLFAIEGFFCVGMVAPIVFSMGSMGGFLAYFVHKSSRVCKQGRLNTIFIIPAAFLLDTQLPIESAQQSVVTQIIIQAPAARVWENVVSFPKIESRWTGIMAEFIPSLERAVIEGDVTKPGAIRRCIFNSGEFVEPIQVWNPPEELTFGVTSGIKRYEKYLKVTKGQFLLKPIGKDQTLLIGTTWYRSKLRPAFYWSLFGERFLHKIHERALEHIKQLSEAS